MCDQHHGPGVLLTQKSLKPFTPRDIQVIGRLVEQNHAGVLEQESPQRNACLLPTREIPNPDVELGIGEPQTVQDHLDFVLIAVAARCFDRLLDALLLLEQLLERIALGIGHAMKDLFELLMELFNDLESPSGCFFECVVRIEVRVLMQVPNSDALARAHASRVGAHQAAEHLEQRALARPVATNDPDLLAGLHRQRHAAQDLSLAERKGQVGPAENGHG